MTTKTEIIKQLENEGYSLESDAKYRGFPWHLVAKKDNLVKVFNFRKSGCLFQKCSFKDGNLVYNFHKSTYSNRKYTKEEVMEILYNSNLFLVGSIFTKREINNISFRSRGVKCSKLEFESLLTDCNTIGVGTDSAFDDMESVINDLI